MEFRSLWSLIQTDDDSRLIHFILLESEAIMKSIHECICIKKYALNMNI